MSIRTVGRDLLSQFPLLDGLFRRFIWSRVFFPENEMRFLNDLPAEAIDVAIDVGAALGSYSWILNKISKQVYAFEPGSMHNKYLNRVVFRTNINVVRAAVGSTSGKVNLYTPGTDSDALHSATVSEGNPIINLKETAVEQIEQTTLDAYFLERLEPTRSIDLLKVDVEGYELEVFQGSIEVLLKYYPLIICEIESRHNTNYSGVFSLLKKLGYICYIYRDGVFELFSDERIEGLQLEDDLKVRLGDNYDPQSNKYINNFVFQHAQSHLKVLK